MKNSKMYDIAMDVIEKSQPIDMRWLKHLMYQEGEKAVISLFATTVLDEYDVTPQVAGKIARIILNNIPALI